VKVKLIFTADAANYRRSQKRISVALWVTEVWTKIPKSGAAKLRPR